MKVRLLDEANDDLTSEADGLQLIRDGWGEYILKCLTEDIDALERKAGADPLFYGYHRRLSKKFPHAIYYDVNVEGLS